MYETKKFKAFVKKTMRERDRLVDLQAQNLINPPCLRKTEAIIPHRRISKESRKSRGIPALTFSDRFAKIVLQERKRFDKINKQLSAQFLLKEDGTI